MQLDFDHNARGIYTRGRVNQFPGDDELGFWGALIGSVASAGSSIYAARRQSKDAKKASSAQFNRELQLAQEETRKLVEQQKMLQQQRDFQASQITSLQPRSFSPTTGGGYSAQKTTLQKATPFLIAGGIALPVLYFALRRRR